MQGPPRTIRCGATPPRGWRRSCATAATYDDAVEVLRDTLRVSGANARIYTELGLIYIAQKRTDMVALVLAKATELDEKDPAVYNALALLALAGKAQEAFDRFDYATKLDPNYIDARFNKASVLLDAGDYTRAKSELRPSSRRSPTTSPPTSRSASPCAG